MIYRISTLSILFFLFVTTYNFSQTTYYVSMNGDDINNGLNENEPFKTLQHAADIMNAGDSVIVLEGNYKGFDIRTSGSQNSPIVFKANENVIIDQPNSVTNDGINIEEADWIIIDGFKIINQPRAGIRIALSDFVVIRKNYCTQNYKWGIFTGFTNDITIENNICSYSEDEHGIYVSNSGDRPTVRNNTCFENNGCGIQLNADASMGGDGIITNAVIEGNILYENGTGGGAAINLDGVQESVIFNNLLYDNHSTGIALFRIDGAGGSKNNKVYNNTIVNPSNSRWAIIAVNGSTGNILYNNILINHHSFRGSISIDESSSNNFISDYNILVDRLSNDDGESSINLSGWQSIGYDLHSQIALPEEDIFTDYSNSNYHLKENSQAINIGTSLAFSIVTKDLDNIPRPQGSGYDIGAYEYMGITVIKEKFLINDFRLEQNYPNPFNPITNIGFRIADLPADRQGFGFVSLKVYDILGKEVASLINEEKPAGKYEMEFSAKGGSASNGNVTNLSSGVYFYQLRIKIGLEEVFVDTKKFILMK